MKIPRLSALCALCALLAALCGSVRPAAGQPLLPAPLASAPEVASYTIDARLDPATKTVHGTGQIRYTNPSNDTLRELVLHLYLNAFSSLDTYWMRTSGGNLRGFRASPTELGGITVERLQQAGGPDLLASATISETVMRVPLPGPLAPGATITLDTAWTSKLPRVFARTGYGGRNDTFFMVGQWYPKMAVYDRGRWDDIPWHGNAEFFHDFGRYDLTVRAPPEYVVAATGVPAGEPRVEGGAKVWRFSNTNVTDVAFAASPDFQVRQTRAANGVDVVLYLLPEHAAAEREYLSTATGAVAAFSEWYGLYPHPRLTVVDVPDSAAGAGGMEYPTLVTGGTLGAPLTSGLVAVVTAHEIGHQWWPMQTATHEGREPWLDEGLTEYSGNRYLAEVGHRIGAGAVSIDPERLERSQAALGAKEPINRAAWDYTGAAYGAAVYGKTAIGLWTLERTVGTGRFRQAMAGYLAAYRYRHPTAAEFRAAIEATLGPQPWFFDQYARGGEIDYAAGPIDNMADGATITVMREGDVAVPVDVRVTLASGVERLERWDGAPPEATFRYPGQQVARVEVDPERKLVAEMDVTDNGASTAIEVAPAATLASRLIFVFQTIAQTLGLFG